ncbi:hypothetical protein LOD99_7001 [Oopsacas minuta]|uniref:Uncharacterized protein n=1 Tax=Oopsacas minuta TaxID=111878 RepID=A0AAV7JJ35_9METZ|nr:hypothetical protein LOD99_7001 [Oopsacas minuta]
MEGDYSNYSMVYSHFPIRSEEQIRGFKEFKYGWWVNGAQYQGDNSNLFKLAPGDMIGSMECQHSLYIAPSWEMVLLIQRSKKSCDNNTDWLVEDKNVWAQLSKVYSGKDEVLTRYSLGFVTSGSMIVKNFMFYALYCIVGHVVTTYVTKLLWNISTLISSNTEFKHT